MNDDIRIDAGELLKAARDLKATVDAFAVRVQQLDDSLSAVMQWGEGFVTRLEKIPRV